MTRSALLLLALFCLGCAPCAADSLATSKPSTDTAAIPPPSSLAGAPNIALVGGRIVTMSGHTYPSGTILIERGKIVDVGNADLDVPSHYQVVDIKGMEVYPGFIDTNTGLGLIEVLLEDDTRDTDEDSDPITPHVRAVDGINVRSEA